jgi:hypothetical protein
MLEPAPLEAHVLYGYGLMATLAILCLILWLMRVAENDATKTYRATAAAERAKRKAKALT